MSIPKRHHYLPQSYLEAWVRGDGRVTQYSRPGTSLIAKPCTPRATGFVENLYSLHGELDPQQREQVELKWMQKIDGAAAPILKQMISDPNQPLPKSHRDAWALFLTSMIFRTPARLDWMHEKIRRHPHQFSEDQRAIYEKLRPAAAPATPEQYFSDGDHDGLSLARMELMLRLIRSQLLGEGLTKMIWRVHSLAKVRYSLLTCDDPVIMSNGLNTGDAFVILPLGPRHLFIAGGSERAIWSYTSQTDRDIERAINDAIVVQADTIVIGKDSGQAAFVDKRLGKHRPADGFLGRHTWKCP